MPLARTLFRRRGPTSPTEADRILERLIDRNRTIDRYDATYLDDLAPILRELHGVTAESLKSHPLREDIERLWELVGRTGQTLTLDELGPDLATSGAVTPERHTPRRASRDEKRRQRYDSTPVWRRAAGRRVGDVDVAVVNELQAEYSRQSGGSESVEFDELARPETGDPWTPLIAELIERGELDPGVPALTIGPRWVGEITYFRETLGLREAVGLDLFSEDEELVKVGDMHRMPFADDTFGLVYQRNTFNKSYDIRTALHECLRVLRDGGILITDDCYDYTDGVSELARTNIKHNDQVVRVLEPNVAEVVYDREEPSREDWIARVGQLAIRVRK